MEGMKANIAARVTVCLFPGHTVKLGMGGSAGVLCREAEGLYRLGERVFGPGLVRLMAEGPLERLRATENAQPAVFLSAMAVFLTLSRLGVKPDLAGGRSLGDLTAVSAAGALAPEEALRVVRRRSEIFARCCARNPGRMSVLLGLGEEAVRAACAAGAAAGGTCVVAGINTDSNFVISGTHAAVAAAERAARESGGHVMDIHMPGAFHSPLMREAAQEFGGFLEGVRFGGLRFPVVDDASPTGFVDNTPSGIRKFLTDQIPAPVDWRRRTAILRSAGAGLILELGPSQGMARISASSVPGCAWRDIEDGAAAERLAAGPGIDG